jgi:hypothetical protein
MKWHAMVPQIIGSDINGWRWALSLSTKGSTERQHCQSHAQRFGMRTKILMPIMKYEQNTQKTIVLYLGMSRDPSASRNRGFVKFALRNRIGFREVERRNHIDLPRGRDEMRLQS